MKKIFYITLFALFTLFMVACDGSKYTFSITVDNVSELRESIVFDLTLSDEDEELENSEIKATISEKGSDSIISTKSLSFSSTSEYELTFTGLEPDTEYSVIVYAGYDGKKVVLVETDVKTSDEGTEESPYSIDSYEDFSNIVAKAKDGYFKLVADIDFNGKSISPMFTVSSPFTGHFDGNGKTIKNFKVADEDDEGNNVHVSSSSQYYGLFGYIGADGEIFNLTLDSFEVYVSRATSLSSSKQSNYGLLAGYCAGTIKDITITNSSLNVKTTNNTKNLVNVGGLVGNLAANGTLSDINVGADINVNGVIDAVVGGICGSTVNAQRMTKVENDVTVKIPNIYNAVYSGNLNVNLEGSTCGVPTSIGGLVGKNYSALIDSCSSEGTITLNSNFTKGGAQTINVGGLIGWMISDLSILSNSTSSVTFDVTTYNVPTVDGETLTVNAGLLVGTNGGGAPAKSMIVDCEYEVKAGSINTINVTADEAVVVTNPDLVANKVSTYNDCLVKAIVTVLVKEYEPATEGAEATVKNETTVTINPAE